MTWVADACTLPTAERPLRVAEFDALFAVAVRPVERVSPTVLRIHLPGGEATAAAAEELAARESACCSFFTFTVTGDEKAAVTLDIEVPPRHADVLASLVAQAASLVEQPASLVARHASLVARPAWPGGRDR